MDINTERVVGLCTHCGKPVADRPVLEMIKDSHFRVVRSLTHLGGGEQCGNRGRTTAELAERRTR